MTAREVEFQRIRECVDRVFNSEKMLFAILAGDSPSEASKIEYEKYEAAGRTIPAEYAEAAKTLYRLAAAGNEFDKAYSQQLCYAIENYLMTVMSPTELGEFKKQNPARYPVKRYNGIFDEFLGEGLMTQEEFDAIYKDAKHE